MNKNYMAAGVIAMVGLAFILVLKNQGPTTRLYGTVRDAITLNGIPGATVRISQVPASKINFTKTTDSSGYYSFTNIPLLEDMAVVVDASAFTYISHGQWILLSDEENVLNIRLDPA